jgi:cytoskeleton protein RodZ
MNNPIPEHQSYVQPSAGAQLRAYREHLQLTVDDVAHHLKLARRQVLAIENDELDALPGPTFVRGFIRNYARLLRIDAQPLLEASGLSTTPSAPIERIGETMGELPADDRPAGGSWTRLFIPTGLVLVLAAGIYLYEMGGVSGVTGKKARKETSVEVAPPQPSAADAPASATQATGTESAPTGDATPASRPADSVAVPAAPSPGAQASAPSAAVAPPPAGVTAPSNALAPLPAAVAPPPAATTGAPAPSSPSSSPQPSAPSTASQADANAATVQLTLSAPSWVEIRDAAGNTLVSGTLDAGASRTFSGRPPFAVKLGKASAVQLQFNGTPVPLGPHTQREIARLTLPPAAR